MEGLFDYKTTGAYKILVSLQGDNTIDSETFVKYMNKLAKVHQYSMTYMQTEKVLSTSLKKLREDNTRTLNEYSELQKQQSELMELINKTSEECRKTKAELSEYENSRLLKKQWAIDRLYEQIDKLKREIDNKEKDQLENLKKQIEKIQEEINEKVANKEKLETDIAKTNQRSKEMQNLKDKIDFNNEKKKKQNNGIVDSIQVQQTAIQGSKKGYEHDSYAWQKRNLEFSENSKKKKELTESLELTKKKIEELRTNVETMQREKNMKDQELDSTIAEERKLNDEVKKQERHIRERNKKKDELILQVKYISKDLNDAKDSLNNRKKDYDNSIRQLKETESESIETRTDLEEQNNILQREVNNRKHLKAEIIRITEEISNLNSDISNKMHKLHDQETLKKQETLLKESFENAAKNLEEVKTGLLDKVDQLKDNIEEMKNLRETISRTVSRLEDSTRSINEEINIKELIYLDMTKRNEELRQMYQKYHILYETVLAERNKNVVKIQNANQRRAELKEKMKIITVEMDILNSELSEIYVKLLEKDKDLSKINARQNALKQEINTYKLKKLAYKEEITKLTNENEKLHSMLNSIESDMVNIRIDYELACENRNYTGIQLIDRNDELCIFYEKIQQLETEIKELYKNILQKESDLQRLSVENAEVERYIEVNRKKIPEIPHISNKIKELDNELKILNKSLEESIKYIESPNNNLKNELPGEDPDIDYLKMKYEQLSDMLNEKKELLLEKELINEEINDIAEKLRKKALEDREKNLDLSEKMNEYQMKLNDITRKNIASTSELSMFKAILFKLEETKIKKEKLLSEASERLENNMPPTDDCMNTFETMNNLTKQKKGYFEKRSREILERENLPIGEIPLRKKPEKRNNQFDDPVTGIPMPYGKHSEFYPNRPNMRHYKNMKPLRTIEALNHKEKMMDINNLHNFNSININ